jgi:hypothetical protein
MKTKSFAVNVSGAAVAALCLFGACLPQISNAQPDSAPPPPDGSAVPVAPDDSATLPPGILPSSPLAQVIKLTQSGVSEDVIAAYVNNSTSLFSLNSNQIVYLKDIGVPDAVVQAMIQRDRVLQSQMASQPQPAPVPDTTVVATADVAPPPTVVTVDYFYDTLSPYGSWVYVEGYGRCWRPTVMVGNAGWQPYGDHGHWVYTDDGWYWMSDYSWGWAPFHYGRWFRDVRFGWCWYPDTVWGPSWVTWRYADDYCGWAPLPPRCDYREGVGFFYNGAAVSIGFDFGLGVGAFTFVHTRDFCDPHPWRHRVESREVTQIFNRTTVINNFDVDREHRTFINHGIDPQHITEVTHAPIRPIAIHETTARVPHGEQLGRDGRTLMVNRPHFSDNPARSGQGGPQHFTQPASAVGSPYQPAHNGNENRNSQPPGHNQATTPPSAVGSPYQSPHNGNQNNNSQPPRNGQPVQTAPVPGQRQFPPVTTSGSPGRNGMTPPAERSTSPGNRSAPVTPVQPSAPNYNSTDNRRYPSPHMQQIEPQKPGVNPGNSGGHVGIPVTPQAPANPPEANRFSPPPAQPPQQQHNYSAPATPPAQPPQRDYVSPRNQTPPSESRPNYSQPPVQGYQSPGASAPSSPPAQSQQPQQSQRSGKGKNQNGQ